MAKFKNWEGYSTDEYVVEERYFGNGDGKYKKESHWVVRFKPCGCRKVYRAGMINRHLVKSCSFCTLKIEVEQKEDTSFLARCNPTSSDYTADPKKYPQGFFSNKECKRCGTMFSPLAPSHMYCSDTCSSKAYEDRYFKRNYGITGDDYRGMLHSQNHKCAICGDNGFIMGKNKHKMLLVVDHCHESGKVRGLLCHNCNRALGLFHDSIDDLKSAIKYLGGSND